MNGWSRKRESGISLIEALIGLVIISLGVLAIARLFGDLVFSTGETKARAEAMQLAEQRIEMFRGELERDAFSTLDDIGDPESVPGTNARFTVLPTVGWDDPETQNRLDIRVVVSWEDREDVIQEVTVSSSVAWIDPLISGNIAIGRLPGTGDGIARPTGRAVTGSDGRNFDSSAYITDPGFEAEDLYQEYEDLDSDYFDRLSGLADEIDASIRYQDGSFQVSDARGFPVLTTRNALLASVRGRVFVESSEEAPLVGGWNVLSSDAAFCGLITDDDRMFSGLSEPYFEYVCLFGAGWFGNIGVLTESADLASTVCAGDPTPAGGDYESWDNVEVQWSPVRRYRGFVGTEESGLQDTFGIGDNGPLFFSRHDFFYANLRDGPGTGSEKRDAQCRKVLDELDGLTQGEFSGSEDGLNFPLSNPGRNVCLLGPGLCLADGDVRPDAVEATVTLRFVSRVEGVTPRDLLIEPLETNEGAFFCNAGTWEQVENEWRISCEVALPDAAASWPEGNQSVKLRLASSPEYGDVKACNEVGALEKRFNGGNSFIRLSHDRTGNTRIATDVEFRGVPSDRLDILYPEESKVPVPICLR